MGCEQLDDVVQFAKTNMTCSNRRQFLSVTLSGCTWLLCAPALRAAEGTSPEPDFLVPRRDDGWPGEILVPPADSKRWPAWRGALASFRMEARRKLNYDDALYRRPDFAWVPTCFACCFLMLNDERFLNARNGRYRVEGFLDAEEEKFGGYDAVVLWQAYPRIGLDDRTQFDFYREMPGGLAGLRDVSRRFRRRRVKVFLCYNPWDKGTRLGGEKHLESLAKMVADVEADGIFLDTMDKAGREFRGHLDAVRPGVALEDRQVLEGRIPPRSIGCFLALGEASTPAQLEPLLKRQRKTLTRHSNNTDFVPSAAVRVPVKPMPARTKPPDGMVRVPAANLELTREFQVREVGFYSASPGRPISGGWLSQKMTFTVKANLAAYAIDTTPVTNAQFAEFLRASAYRPRVKDNFLKHWSNGKPPGGREDHPAVYVALEDARAYAAWARKRLPTEDEWQYAAQGPAGLAYPWGAEDDPTCRNGGERGGTSSVRAFPKGRSPFGAWDLCGNVWELTESEHSDGRNRFVMLKGGSYYRAEGSMWYFDGGARPNRHAAKMLLFWPGLDRCATVGFRCVVDLQSSSE
jgi:formylglycine-generating enzyme required for sulfatase activity